MKDDEDAQWYIFLAIMLILAAIILFAAHGLVTEDESATMKHEGTVIVDKVVISDEEMAFQSRRDAPRASRSRTYNFEVSETEEAFHETPTEKEPPVQQARTTTTAEQSVASNGLADTPDVWDRLANCESGGRWDLNTGNGYYGGIQFSLRSWQWVGGTGYPHEHTREHQIAMGARLVARQGWAKAFPSCSRQLGLSQ